MTNTGTATLPVRLSGEERETMIQALELFSARRNKPIALGYETSGPVAGRVLMAVGTMVYAKHTRTLRGYNDDAGVNLLDGGTFWTLLDRGWTLDQILTKAEDVMVSHYPA